MCTRGQKTREGAASAVRYRHDHRHRGQTSETQEFFDADKRPGEKCGLGPWSRDASVACFERLAASYGLVVDDGVADAVYAALGVGIPHHVQSFFARLRDFAVMRGRDRLRVEDVRAVYQGELLGPSGQNDLVHYETRLKEALGDEEHRFAMEILAEAATTGVFAARRCLDTLYSAVVADASERIADTLDVLVHDGYLDASDDGHRFTSRLLKDWWRARFRDPHVPLATRVGGVDPGGAAQ